MEALVCVEPQKLRLESRPSLKVGPSQVLVRPRRIGICGTDYHIFEGKHPYLEYPRVMGHELAVEVISAPAGSDLNAGETFALNPYVSCGHCIACRRGKRNCCVQISVIGVHQDGGMATELVVPEENLIPADGLTLDQMATIEFLAIGAHAVRRAAVAAQDRVLVVGAGPIGLGVALFASLSGATVAVFDGQEERAQIASSITGAAPLSPEYLDTSMHNFTSGESFDVVFDATGSSRAMERGFDYVAHGGRYVLVSVVKDAISFMDPDFHKKEMTLYGSRNATTEDFAHVVAAIRGGNVPVDRLITHRTSLHNALTDIPRWAADRSSLIKALVEIDGNL